MEGPVKLTMLYELPGFIFIIRQESRLCGSTHGAIQELQDSDCGVGRAGFGKYFPCLWLASLLLLPMCRMVNFNLGEQTWGKLSFFLLPLLREIERDQLQEVIVLQGVCAGTMCWGPSGNLSSEEVVRGSPKERGIGELVDYCWEGLSKCLLARHRARTADREQFYRCPTWRLSGFIWLAYRNASKRLPQTTT